MMDIDIIAPKNQKFKYTLFENRGIWGRNSQVIQYEPHEC